MHELLFFLPPDYSHFTKYCARGDVASIHHTYDVFVSFDRKCLLLDDR